MSQRQTLWRPQWNLPLAVTYLAAGAGMVATSYGNTVDLVIGGSLGLACAVVAVRTALVRVVLRPEGVLVANVWGTHRVAWTTVVGVGRPNPTVSRPVFCLLTIDGRAIRLDAFPAGHLRYRRRYGGWAELIDRTRIERAGPVPRARRLRAR
jgi:hypothetical protein